MGTDKNLDRNQTLPQKNHNGGFPRLLMFLLHRSAYLVVPATAYRNTGLGSGIPDYRMAGLEQA